MWLNQNFLLPEGINSPNMTFTALRGEGLLAISMSSSGEVCMLPNMCVINSLNVDHCVTRQKT